MTFYILRQANPGDEPEIVDEHELRSEARRLVAEYRRSDKYGLYSIRWGKVKS